MQCCAVEMRVMEAGRDEQGEYLLFRCPICGREEKVHIEKDTAG